MASEAGELAEYGGGEARRDETRRERKRKRERERVVEGSRCTVTLRPCYFVNARCRGASRDRITARLGRAGGAVIRR